MTVADPTFTLSSDFYYRGLLAKVDSFLVFMCKTNFNQIYEKSKLQVREALDSDKPKYMSLALDGWSQHHHGYIGAITSKCSIFIPLYLPYVLSL